MVDSSLNGNGCYLLIGADKKVPIKRSLAAALEQLLAAQENQTGKIIIHVKAGGVSAVQLETVWVE